MPTNGVTGKVIFFNESKGYGFIKPNNMVNDIFVHHADISSGVTITEGDYVVFDIIDGAKGYTAINVKLIDT